MKVQSRIELRYPPQQVWDILQDFSTWKEWNNLVTHITGSREIGDKLQLEMKYPGAQAAVTTAVLSGYKAPKYFSFSWESPTGGWWHRLEVVHRLVESSGGTDLISEAFVFGLRLRFGRGGLEDRLKRLLTLGNYSIKELLAAKSPKAAASGN